MRRICSVLFVAVLSFALVAPVAASPRFDDEEAVITFTATDNVPYETRGEDNLEPGEQADTTIVWEGTYGPHYNDRFGGVLGLELSCEGETCTVGQDLYIEMIMAVTWSCGFDCPIDTLYGDFQGFAEGAEMHTYFGGCTGTLRGGSCFLHVNSVLPAEEIISEEEEDQTIAEIQAAFGIYNVYDLPSFSPLWSWTITVSTEPIEDNCTDYEPTGNVASGILPATSETGVSVTLEVGLLYRLTISGGPWNDSAHDRFDAAYRQGVDAWIPLGSSAEECVSSTEGSATVVFTSTSTALGIRVNDSPGHFGDNTGALDYSVDLVRKTSPGNCGGQFTPGNFIAAGTLPATSSSNKITLSGSKNGGYISAGSWISITTSGGPWQDDGAGSDRYDAAISQDNITWQELSVFDLSGCATPRESYITIYVQVANPLYIYLRVNDTGGNWAANTGSLDYSIFSVTYSPWPPGGCAELYELGDLIDSVTVSANSSTGMQLSVEPVEREKNALDAYVAIETDGVWLSEGAVPSGAGAMSYLSSGPWSSIQEFPAVTCAVALDPVGHYRVYLPLEKNGNSWYLRADAGSFTGNLGSLTFLVYKAELLQYIPPSPDPPGPGLCDDEWSHETPGDTLGLQANNEAGISLPTTSMTKSSNGYFAIETSAGPWLNNGVESYYIAISDDDGATWTLQFNYASALCSQSADGNHVLTYLRALQGRTYKVRVYDPYENFTDNTESINVIFYDQVTRSRGPWTPCSTEYSITEVSLSESQRSIPSQLAAGVKVMTSSTTTKNSTNVYALEISDENYWTESSAPDQHRYDAEFSLDGGATWYYFGPGEDGIPTEDYTCMVEWKNESSSLPTYQQHFRIYFTATSPDYRLRVYDQDGNFPNNARGIYYTLYYAAATTTPEPGPAPNPLPGPWGSACYEDYPRPVSYFKLFHLTDAHGVVIQGENIQLLPAMDVPAPAIDDWAEYLSWALRNYVAWCPEHTEAIKQLGSGLLAGKEPVSTYNAFKTFIDAVKTDFDSYNFTGKESNLTMGVTGGESGKNDPQPTPGPAPNDLIMFLTTGFDKDKSPWFGGEIDLVPTTKDGEVAAATKEQQDYCKSNYTSFFGDKAAESTCKMLVLFNESPYYQVVILALDILLIVFMVTKYIPGWFRRLFDVITNKKST